MKIRLVHTSDIHLDVAFTGTNFPPEFGNKRRQALRDVLRAVFQYAREWQAHAVLIAGDLLEATRVTRDTVLFLQKEFAAIHPLPVFIVPGNHDPYTIDSVYATTTWPENVIIFSSPDWKSIRLDDVPLTVHGFAFDGPQIAQNPFSNFVMEPDDHFHVVLAHGSEMGNLPPNKDAYAPFKSQQLDNPALRYVALGHYHSFKEITTPRGTKLCYPGSPEGLGFNETEERYFVAVEIDEDSTVLNRIPSAKTVFTEHNIDCSSFSNAQEIVDAIRGCRTAGPLSQIARVYLIGKCADSLREQFPALHDVTASEFAFLDVVDLTEPDDDYEMLARENSGLGIFVKEINHRIASTSNADLRAVLLRAREVGVAAYLGRELPVRETGRGHTDAD